MISNSRSLSANYYSTFELSGDLIIISDFSLNLIFIIGYYYVTYMY